MNAIVRHIDRHPVGVFACLADPRTIEPQELAVKRAALGLVGFSIGERGEQPHGSLPGQGDYREPPVLMMRHRALNDMIEPIDRHESIDRSDAHDAIEPTDRIEPTEPTDSTDPLEPTDSTEPLEPTDSTEP